MKHVLVIVDKREGTASRKKDATDLMTLWKNLTTEGGNLKYQLATYPLPIGDVWVCSSDIGPFYVPTAWQFPPPAETNSCGIVKTEETLDNFFQLPSDPITAEELSSPSSIVGPDLETGDDKFPPARPDIVIERKTLADLTSSYGDGRYKDQKARLVNCDAGLVMFLVEGFQGGRVKDPSLKKRFLSTFVHSMFRDNIPVYHTVNLQESFEFLHHLATEMALRKLERSTDYMERTKYTDNIQMTRKQNLTPDRGLEMVLASIPGISAKMARAVQTAHSSLFDLCQAYQRLGDDERAKHDLLADLTFRGSSGKEQRLASRSSKIYQYITGQESEKPPKRPKSLKEKTKKRQKMGD